jgi:ribonucleotide monophosphatase NagD (HAD superfamily)
MCSLITASTGVSPRYFGKPWKETVDMLASLTGYAPSEMAFVGDRLYTDVATGVNNGARGFLVLTGEATMQTVRESDVEPTCIYDSLADMHRYL